MLCSWQPSHPDTEIADVEGEVWPDQRSEKPGHLEEKTGLKKAVATSGCRGPRGAANLMLDLSME